MKETQKTFPRLLRFRGMKYLTGPSPERGRGSWRPSVGSPLIT